MARSVSAVREGTVCFVKEERGYALIRPDSAEAEDERVLLLFSTAHRDGFDDPEAGGRIAFHSEIDDRGVKVSEVIEMTSPEDSEEPVEGVVKSFNRHRGFGFVEVKGLRRDVFLHVRVISSCDLPSITEGARVFVSYETERKGINQGKIRATSLSFPPAEGNVIPLLKRA